MNEQEVKALWRKADLVCFDVDSTVCIDEAVDELAAFLGVRDEVAKLTNEAMGGSMTYYESLSLSLNIMKPNMQSIVDFKSKNPPKLTPGICELVEKLHRRGVAVHLISGGFHSIIEAVASMLHIPYTNIHANRLVFYHDGEYAGFDMNQPTCQTGGKPKVIQSLKEKHGYMTVVHIGDGVTDMEASPPADAFIGFGGNQIREKVKHGSKWFTMNMQELIKELG